ncbi:MAG: hypothetical protein MUP69_10225 [Candidatus Atribacteria bacterium]|nr:hypothetical protein [Candidatus Atribacteria bacterium]
MTITKLEILTHLNKELNRSEAQEDIDEYILEALKDLSLRDNFLWVETTVPTIDGRAYYSVPEDYKSLLVIKIDDNTPLCKITFREYQQCIAGQTTDNEGEPYCFAIHGGFIYPYPVPNMVYIMTLHYVAFILETEDAVLAIDNIPFKDIYRQAIYALTKAYYCLSKGLTDDANTYLTLFSNILLPPLQKLIERETRSIEYQDL